MGRIEVANRGLGFLYDRYRDDYDYTTLNWSAVLPESLDVYGVPNGLQDWQKACYVGKSSQHFSGYENTKSLDFDNLEEYVIKNLLISALGICFERMYDLPKDCIRSVCDYNEDFMFFMCVTWPPKENNNNVLSELTQDKFLEMINEFFSKITGKNKMLCSELEMCEEYIKW